MDIQVCYYRTQFIEEYGMPYDGAWEQCHGCVAWVKHIPDEAIHVCPLCDNMVLVTNIKKCPWCDSKWETLYREGLIDWWE
jgi:hypothetical protein